MGDAAGELAHGFHLLRLAQGLLRLLQLAGAFAHPLFQRFGQGFLVVDIGVGADPAHHFAAAVADRLGAGDVPAIVRHRRGAGGIRFRKPRPWPAPRPRRRRRQLDILGMHHVGPASAVKRAGHGLAVGIDLAVEPVEHAVGLAVQTWLGMAWAMVRNWFSLARTTPTTRARSICAQERSVTSPSSASSLAVHCARRLVMDRHQGGQAAFLDQGHADGGGDSDRLEACGRVRRQFLQVVVEDQGLAGMEFLHGQRAEIGQAVVPQNAGRAGRAPFATDGKAVLIGVHVGIGADRDAKFFAHHAGGGGQYGVGIQALGCFPSQHVQKAQTRFIVAKHGLALRQALALGLGGAFRQHPLGGFHHHGDHAGGLAAFVDHRRIIQVHPAGLEHAPAVQRQFAVLVGQGVAGEPGLHYQGVEVGGFRPAFQHLAAQQPGMAAAGKDAVAVIVNHDAVRPPQQHQGHGRMDHQADNGLEALRPGFDRPQRGGPVMGGDHRAHGAAARQKRGQVFRTGAQIGQKRPPCVV